MRASEHLPETAWKQPSDYGGFSPVGDYCIMSQHRDSDALTRSNWECACKQLGAEPFDDGHYIMSDTEYDARPMVYHWRARHWAVGWVECLMVRPDAPDDTLESAGEILCSLESYPVLDDDHFSALECHEACEMWAASSLANRLHYIRDTGISIFAIRRDDMPSDDCGTIQQRLNGV